MVTNSSTITTTDYDGNYIYTNSALSQILQPEGYIVPNGSTYQYYFQYKDNLNSNRLTYSDFNGDGTISPSEIVEEDNYYPFGLKQQGYNNTHNGTGSMYKYNGKELQDDAVGSYHLNLYDYGARFYDPALGRWMTIDPLAEESRRWTTYNYALDNPIRFIDIDGMYVPGDYYDKNTKKYLYSDNKKDNKVYEVSTIPPVSSSLKGDTGQKPEIEYVGTVKSVNMTFTGKENPKDIKEADGKLNLFQKVSNGKTYKRASFNAVGGPWGNGAPENGNYTVNDLLNRGPSGWYNPSMTKDGIGFSLNLNPSFATHRTNLRIHPDGGKYFGTLGCIGLTGGKSELVNFRGLMQKYLTRQTNIPLLINIKNNPNNNGEN